ncbi:MAG: hypothetical protein J0M25_00660 [Flavobacteriales bacterium]|nr:hypothetical protein [Flavobacteriales bacterium]
MNRYFLLKDPETLEVYVSLPMAEQPENSLPFVALPYKGKFDQYPDPTQVIPFVEPGLSNEQKANTIALFEAYPDLSVMNYKLLALDNLEGIKRDSTLADKGLKGEKKYRKNGVLIWSSEKKYWFQEGGYEPGFRRITKIFNLDESVADLWENYYELSADDKEFFKKQQRELIFEYFKSQQPALFNLLYTFFKEEIDRYVMKDGPELAAVLTDAAVNHPMQIVRDTLSSEVPTLSGGTVTVLQGILAELV